MSAAGFLDRLDARWLQAAWDPARFPAEAARARAAARHVPDIQLRYATLLGRLGPALDGPDTLADADAWYFILEGTSEPSVAQAQAMALTELAAHAATDQNSEPRAILLAADTKFILNDDPAAIDLARQIIRHRLGLDNGTNPGQASPAQQA